MRSARLAPGLARITASKVWSDLAAGLGFGACLLLASLSAGTLAFGSLSLTLNALSAQETMSGKEPARISDAASAAVESDLRRATMSEGSGSGLDTTLGETSLNMKYYLRVMVTPPPKEAFVYLMPEEKRYADQQQYPVAPVALHRGPSPSLMATPTVPRSAAP